MYCQKKRSGTYTCGGKSELKKYIDPSEWDRSDPDDGRGNKPERKGSRGHCRGISSRQRTFGQDNVCNPDSFSANWSLALSKQLDQFRVRSDSDPEGEVSRQRRHWSKPYVVRPLNELSARVVSCCEYRVVINNGSYQDLLKYVLCFRKKTEVQWRPHVFSGRDPSLL